MIIKADIGSKAMGKIIAGAKMMLD